MTISYKVNLQLHSKFTRLSLFLQSENCTKLLNVEKSTDPCEKPQLLAKINFMEPFRIIKSSKILRRVIKTQEKLC
jgi:hypothetical protein